jgi:hypothetical protein
LTAAVARRAGALADVLAGFLLAAGVAPRSVQKALRDAAARVTARRDTRRVTPTASIWTQLSDAVALWFRDPRYVDEHGRALPIPEHGPAPSVDHLLASCVDTPLQPRARELLREHVEIDRHGLWRYVLTEGALRLRDDAIVERLELGLSRMCDNFLFNSTFVAEPEQKNCDRVAAVDAFPVEMLPAFRRRMQRDLALSVYDANDWMTKQQRTHTRGQVCEAGVGVYVFTGPPRDRRETDDGGSAPKRATGTRRRTTRPGVPKRRRKRGSRED